MPLVVRRVSIARKILMVAACLLSCAWLQVSPALAQHVGHAGGGGGGQFRTGGHISAPHVVSPPASRAMFFHTPNGLPDHSFFIFRRPFLNPAPFLWSWQAFNSSWWLYCGPIWGWYSGCGDFLSSAPITERYLAPPHTYASPVYIY